YLEPAAVSMDPQEDEAEVEPGTVDVGMCLREVFIARDHRRPLLVSPLSDDQILREAGNRIELGAADRGEVLVLQHVLRIAVAVEDRFANRAQREVRIAAQPVCKGKVVG